MLYCIGSTIHQGYQEVVILAGMIAVLCVKELASLHTLAPGEGAQADQTKTTRERDIPSETQKRVSLDQTNELRTSDLPEMSLGSGGRSPGEQRLPCCGCRKLATP